MSNIGDKIKNQREKLKLSQRKLAKLADLSNDYISKIEMGKVVNVGVVTLKRIAHALDIPMFDLDPVAFSTQYKSSKKQANVVREPASTYGSKSDLKSETFFALWQELTVKDKDAFISLARQLLGKKI